VVSREVFGEGRDDLDITAGAGLGAAVDETRYVTTPSR
jgi:hypothetical protein